ncbi:hypothetical protein OWM07_03185 [Deferribacter thermophilus]|uniref:hypothetical protein n=1 Tax=Deferribacter thermophilus TaxID=53573 RepID=UPI003C166A28
MHMFSLPPIPIHIYDNWFGFLYNFVLALSEKVYSYLTGGFNPVVIASISFLFAYLHPFLRYTFSFGTVFGQYAEGVNEVVEKVIKRDFWMKLIASAALIGLLMMPVQLKITNSSSILVPKNVFTMYLQDAKLDYALNYFDFDKDEYTLPAVLALSVSIVDTVFYAVTETIMHLTGTTDFDEINVEVLQKFMDSWDLKDIETAIQDKVVNNLYGLDFNIPQAYNEDTDKNIDNLKYSLALYVIIAKSLYGMYYEGSTNYMDPSSNVLYAEFINNIMRFLSGKEKDFTNYLASADSNVKIRIQYNETNKILNETYKDMNTIQNLLLAHPELAKVFTLMLSWYDSKNWFLREWLKSDIKQIYNLKDLRDVMAYYNNNLSKEQLNKMINLLFVDSNSPYNKLLELIREGKDIPVNTFADEDEPDDYYEQLKSVLLYEKDELDNTLPIIRNYRDLYLGLKYAVEKDEQSLDQLIATTGDNIVKQVLQAIKTNISAFTLIRGQEAGYVKQVAQFYSNIFLLLQRFEIALNNGITTIEKAQETYEKLIQGADGDLKQTLQDRKEDFVLFELLNIPVKTLDGHIKEPGLMNKVALITKESFIYALVVLFFFIFCILSIFLFILYIIQRFIAFTLYFILSPLYIIKAITTQTFNETITAYFVSWVNFRAYDFGLLIGYIILSLIVKILNIFSVYLVFLYKTNMLGIKLAYMSILVMGMFISVQVMKFIYRKITSIVNNKFDVIAESFARVSDMAMGQAMALGSAGARLLGIAKSIPVVGTVGKVAEGSIKAIKYIGENLKEKFKDNKEDEEE